jgi:putative FmdB family regulatory protein
VPLYTYKCRACHQQFEIRHSYKDKNISCLHCGHKELEKIMTPINYQKSSTTPRSNSVKTGDLVHQAISDNTKETKAYKQELLKKAASGKK